jgi:hypothetical protein
VSCAVIHARGGALLAREISLFSLRDPSCSHSFRLSSSKMHMDRRFALGSEGRLKRIVTKMTNARRTERTHMPDRRRAATFAIAFTIEYTASLTERNHMPQPQPKNPSLAPWRRFSYELCGEPFSKLTSDSWSLMFSRQSKKKEGNENRARSACGRAELSNATIHTTQ